MIIPPQPILEIEQVQGQVQTDFQEIKGQEHIKRALEVAASGGHNMLMIVAPGAGKTLMARALPSILPRMTIEESLDVTRIYSVADALPAGVPLIKTRPFRSPHHTISHAGLVGVVTFLTPVRFRRLTAAYSFSMNFLNSDHGFWKYCASRSKIK